MYSLFKSWLNITFIIWCFILSICCAFFVMFILCSSCCSFFLCLLVLMWCDSFMKSLVFQELHFKHASHVLSTCYSYCSFFILWYLLLYFLVMLRYFSFQFFGWFAFVLSFFAFRAPCWPFSLYYLSTKGKTNKSQNKRNKFNTKQQHIHAHVHIWN